MINPNHVSGKKFLFNAFFSLFLVFIITGCETDPEEFGTNFVSPMDSIAVASDTTFELESFVYRLDPVNTSQARYPVLGRTEDPYFGKVRSGFFTQLNYSDIMDFGTNPVPDSVFLYLIVNNYYDKNEFDNIDVYQLNQPIYSDEVYMSDLTPEDYYMTPKISQGTSYKEDTIKIQLDRSYGALLMANDTSAINADSLFYENVPGLYCTMGDVENRGNFAQIDLSDPHTKLSLWYHNNTTEEGKSVRFDYKIHQELAHFNEYKYDTTSLPVGEENVRTYLANDPEVSDSLLFVAGPAGYGVRFELPEGIVDRFDTDSIMFASAELILPVASDYTNYNITEDLFLYNFSEVDTLELSFGNSVYFPQEKYFKFNVTNFVHNFVEGTYGKNIYLQIRNNTYQPGRMVFTGKGNANPPKFKIKYYKP